MGNFTLAYIFPQYCLNIAKSQNKLYLANLLFNRTILVFYFTPENTVGKIFYSNRIYAF